MKAWQCVLIFTSAHPAWPPGPVREEAEEPVEYLLGFVLWKLTQYSAVQSLYQMAREEHVERKPGLSASPVNA